MWGRRSVGKVPETPAVNTVPEETVAAVTKATEKVIAVADQVASDVKAQEPTLEVAVEAAPEAVVEKVAPMVVVEDAPEVPVKDAPEAVVAVEVAPPVSSDESAPKPAVNGEATPAAVPNDESAPKAAAEGETAPDAPTHEGPVAVEAQSESVPDVDATPEVTVAKDVTEDDAPKPVEVTPVLEGGEPAPEQPAESIEEAAPKVVEETYPGLETSFPNAQRKLDICSLGPQGIALVRDVIFSDDPFERARAKLSLSSDLLGKICHDCNLIGAIGNLEDLICISDLNAVEVLTVMFEMGQDGCRRAPRCPCGAVLMKLDGPGKYGHEKCPVVTWFCEKFSVEYDSENGVVKYLV